MPLSREPERWAEHTMSNPNDKIRDSILREFYRIHSTSVGQTLTHVETNIRNLPKIKNSLGLDKADFYSNLDYLVQKGWITKTDRVEMQTDHLGHSREYHHINYKISSEGIDRLEDASTYKREEMGNKINITNIRGVTVVGSGNIVNVEHTDLSELISDLIQKISSSDNFEEEQKLDLTSDLNTIQNQLSKTKPDKSIIGKVWSGIEHVVTAGGFVELATKIGELINNIPY
jgi:preprotein translocase subunit SecD